MKKRQGFKEEIPWRAERISWQRRTGDSSAEQSRALMGPKQDPVSHLGVLACKAQCKFLLVEMNNFT